MWKVLLKDVDLGRPDVIPWPRLFGLHSKRMSNKQRYCGQLQKYVWIPESLQEMLENYLVLRNLTRTCPHGPMMWKVMQRNAWNDVANWRTEQLNSYTKSQLHALTTISLRKRKWDLFESCQKFARKLSSNVCNWHALVDQTLYEPWTNLHVLSPNGPDHATNV